MLQVLGLLDLTLLANLVLIVIFSGYENFVSRLDIADDGAGVDTTRVRTKAVERGLIPADRADALTEYTQNGWAAFGEATITLTKTLDLTIGLRHHKQNDDVQPLAIVPATARVTPVSTLFAASAVERAQPITSLAPPYSLTASDGSGLTLLDPGNASHTSSLSPSVQRPRVRSAHSIIEAAYWVMRSRWNAGWIRRRC